MGCSTEAPKTDLTEIPERIVSMAPSVTESIYAAGGVERLVGLTRFCTYPKEIMDLPRIGGFTDTNYEYLYKLEPDLAILQKEHYAAPERLDQLGIAYLEIDTSTIPMIYESIRKLGQAFGTEDIAEASIQSLQERVLEITAKTKNSPKRKVLISIGRNMGTGGLTDVYVAGSSTLYSEILELIGAVNVYEGSLQYAKISTEGIMHLNPDVIIDLIPDLQTSLKLTHEQVIAEWQTLGSVSAVQNGEVHVYDGDYVTIPGPRFILVMEDIARAVYPEHFTERTIDD